LEEIEKACGVDITISKFVSDNYRSKRLFLTPDHPSVHVYKYVAKEIANRIGVELDKSFFASETELQPELKIPIMPQVSEQLGLEFCDTEYENAAKLGKAISMLQLAKLEYYSVGDRVALTAGRSTFAKRQPQHSRSLGLAEVLAIERGDIVVGIMNPMDRRDGHYCVDIAELRRAADGLFVPIGRRAYLFDEHWMVGW